LVDIETYIKNNYSGQEMINAYEWYFSKLTNNPYLQVR
jgi:hypothetical protein